MAFRPRRSGDPLHVNNGSKLITVDDDDDDCVIDDYVSNGSLLIAVDDDYESDDYTRVRRALPEMPFATAAR